jgi:hypothetical protein
MGVGGWLASRGLTWETMTFVLLIGVVVTIVLGTAMVLGSNLTWRGIGARIERIFMPPVIVLFSLTFLLGAVVGIHYTVTQLYGLFTAALTPSIVLQRAEVLAAAGVLVGLILLGLVTTIGERAAEIVSTPVRVLLTTTASVVGAILVAAIVVLLFVNNGLDTLLTVSDNIQVYATLAILAVVVVGVLVAEALAVGALGWINRLLHHFLRRRAAQ